MVDYLKLWLWLWLCRTALPIIIAIWVHLTFSSFAVHLSRQHAVDISGDIMKNL